MEYIDGANYAYLTTCYNKMSAKQKELSNQFRHYTNKLNTLVSMFDYKKRGSDKHITLTDEYHKYFDPVFMEISLLNLGYCIIGEMDGQLLPMVGSRTGKLNPLGLGEEVNAITQNGKSFRGTLHKDCVIIYNNLLHLPEMDLAWYSEMFTETDKSLEVALLTCRDTMLPVVTDDKMKNAVVEAVKAMRDGKPMAVISKNLIEQLMDGDNKILSLPLNHPEGVKNIQYILKAYDDIERRFWLKYGHNSRNTEKMAQVSEAEITGADSISQVYPAEMKKAREKGIQEVNELFPEAQIDFDFSDIWKTEYENYKTDPDDVLEGGAQAGDGAPDPEGGGNAE